MNLFTQYNTFWVCLYMWPWTTKPVLSSMDMFVAIAKNRFFYYAKNHEEIK